MSEDWYKTFINVIENPVKKDETSKPEEKTDRHIHRLDRDVPSIKSQDVPSGKKELRFDKTVTDHSGAYMPDDESMPFTRSGKGETDENKDPILFHRTMNKLVILGKAGMLDHDSVMKLRQSFKIMLDGKVPSTQQRAVLLTVLDKLITLITSDMSLFNRIRSDLQRDKSKK
jgi:hypothetical protein|tara:strand:+ start:3605 stop:4120 length:516 start_codon:yes stop_codon:yes gene_type:complete